MRAASELVGLHDQRDAVVEAGNDLVRRFGEKAGPGQVEQLVGHLLQFFRDVDAAAEDLDKWERLEAKKKARAARQAAKKAAKGGGSRRAKASPKISVGRSRSGSDSGSSDDGSGADRGMGKGKAVHKSISLLHSGSLETPMAATPSAPDDEIDAHLFGGSGEVGGVLDAMLLSMSHGDFEDIFDGGAAGGSTGVGGTSNLASRVMPAMPEAMAGRLRALSSSARTETVVAAGGTAT